MKYNIPLPRLLDASGNEIRRINVQSASVHLSISPLSTASLDLLKGETVPMRSWVEVFTSGGSAGIFRSRAPQEGYGDLQNSVELDHGICEIGDYIVKADLEEETTAAAAITKIFSHYGGTLWNLGTVESNATVTLECDHDNVLSAIGEIMDQIPGYMFSFNQSVRPWVLSIIARPSNVTAEGRLSRNVQSARITEDDSELCTRVYMDELSNGHMDADTISTYGVVEKSLTGGANITAAQAQRMASVYLEKHKRPALSIDIQGQDLAAITGETLDALAIGKKYRLAMPQYSRTVEETIVGLNWDDVYNNPGAVQVMLSEQGETVISYLNKQNKSGGRSGGKARRKNEKQVKEFETEFVQTNTEISLRAYQRDLNNTDQVLKDAGIGISVEGVMTYSLDNTKGVGAALKVNSDKIGLVVEGTGANAHIKPASIVASINGQTGSHILISADQIDIDGIVTSLLAESVGFAHLDVTGESTLGDDVLCENDLTALGVIRAASVGSQSGGGYVWLDDAVGSIGPATASGGQITIPWTKMDGTAGTAVNFNIADTQYYQDGVAAAELQGQTEAGVQINTEDGQIERALNSATKAVSITAAASIAYDSNTHQYTATGKARAGGNNIEMDSATATSGTEAYSAGVAAGEAEYTPTSVTLQGEQQGVYVEAQSGGTDYYTAGSSVSYYPGNGGSFTVQGSALSYKIREYGYQQFYRKNSDGTYSAVGGERRWFWQNSEGNQYYNAGTVTKHDRGSAVSVTPINASSKKHLLNTIRYKAGTTVSDTYYTRSSS